MPLDIIEITHEERDEILEAQEGHHFDVKAKEISPAKLTETLSAFANANGGEVYVGIDERDVGGKKVKEWRGFEDQESANGHIQAIEEYFPLDEYCGYDFVECKNCNGLLIKVEINKTREVRKASNNKAYVRRGAQNLPINTAEKLRRLEWDKGITSYETNPIEVAPEIIDKSPILRQFLLNLIPSAKPLDWLKRQLLVRAGKPTVAAILLFAEEPQAVLPKCAVKILRYRTRDTEGSRSSLSPEPLAIEGCLYQVIRSSVQKTTELIEEAPKLGALGLEAVNYPPETLHEIITNAVLHRDYSIARDIQIRVFDNRIEVESPGKLPGHITEENILHEQFSRNGVIVRWISRFRDPPNKDIGEGLNTAFAAMKRLKLKAPEIRENENSVTVFIRHERLASPEEAVLQYLDTHEEIRNSKARELTGITSENSMKQVFYRLRDKSLIEQVPNKRGASSAWRKTGWHPRLF